MNRDRLFLLLWLLVIMAMGCNRWDYRHQDRWPRRYPLCSQGYQSPIDIETDRVQKDSSLSPLFVDYLPVDTFVVKRTANLLYITHLQGSVTAPDTNFWGHEYFLAQIILHTPSEHSVDREFYPAEIQFVNIDTANNIMVISTLVKEGESNPAFSTILANIPARQSQLEVIQTLDVNKLLPFGAGYWHYWGSMTFPPCQGNVQWFVMKAPVEASAAQLDSLRRILGNNSRSIENLGNRKITEF